MRPARMSSASKLRKSAVGLMAIGLPAVLVAISPPRMLASTDRPRQNEVDTMKTTRTLRRLLTEPGFIYMPVAYDALGGRLVADTGFPAVYNGGVVTGGTRRPSEPPAPPGGAAR